MKYIDNKIIKDGTDDIELGAEDKYLGVCWNCWFYKTIIQYFYIKIYKHFFILNILNLCMTWFIENK